MINIQVFTKTQINMDNFVITERCALQLILIFIHFSEYLYIFPISIHVSEHMYIFQKSKKAKKILLVTVPRAIEQMYVHFSTQILKWVCNLKKKGGGGSSISLTRCNKPHNRCVRIRHLCCHGGKGRQHENLIDLSVCDDFWNQCVYILSNTHRRQVLDFYTHMCVYIYIHICISFHMKRYTYMYVYI